MKISFHIDIFSDLSCYPIAEVIFCNNSVHMASCFLLNFYSNGIKTAGAYSGQESVLFFPDGELAVCVLDPLLQCVGTALQIQLESARTVGLVVKLHICTDSSSFGVSKHFLVAIWELFILPWP